MGESIERNIDLSTFKKNFDEMVIKSESFGKILQAFFIAIAKSKSILEKKQSQL